MTSDMAAGIGERHPAPPLPIVYLRAIRPKQWLKNLLLFSGLFLNTLFARLDLWLVSAAGFASNS